MLLINGVLVMVKVKKKLFLLKIKRVYILKYKVIIKKKIIRKSCHW